MEESPIFKLGFAVCIATAVLTLAWCSDGRAAVAPGPSGDGHGPAWLEACVTAEARFVSEPDERYDEAVLEREAARRGLSKVQRAECSREFWRRLVEGQR